MESEFLKEPWMFPRTKTNSSTKEEAATFSAWEEDFQDLSSWCMDPFQGQCNFHIGESTTFKLSGMYTCLYIYTYIKLHYTYNFYFIPT